MDLSQKAQGYLWALLAYTAAPSHMGIAEPLTW